MLLLELYFTDTEKRNNEQLKPCLNGTNPTNFSAIRKPSRTEA